MKLETVLNISWLSIYHQLTFVVLLTIHPAVSGCAELFPTYINNNQKISNSEIRKDDVKRFKACQTEKRKV